MERPSVHQLIAQAAEEQWEELNLSGMELTELPPEIGQLGQLKRLFLGKRDAEKKGNVGNRLMALPQALWQLEELEELYLSGNQLCEIPDSIAQLVNLKILDLDDNPIEAVSDAIAQLINLETLFLDNHQLKRLPDSISQLKNLREISLNNSGLTTIPEWISELTNLTGLYLQENQITVIPDSLAQLSNLTKLSLGGNQITVIPDSLAQLSNLTELDLGGNQITVIPDSLTQLSNLTELSLVGNQITVIPDSLAQLSNLTELYLGGNQITVIPDSLAQLSNLTELYLVGNQITVIPDSLAQLSNLTKLNVRKNQIMLIPDSLAQLSNLTKLSFGENQIAVIPDSLAQLSNLTELYLFGNQITVIPDSLAQLSNLTQLDLRKNQITVIPDWLAQLSSLTELYLGENQVTVIPDSLVQLSNLTQLHLGGNQITVIPDSLVQLSNLSQLHLGGNQITVIPDSLAQLSNLTQLRLWNNQITVIPDSLVQLSNLTQLDLGGNQITVIPDSLAQLSNLTQLRLRNNQITVIPDSLAQLSNLTQLDLGGNQITVIPDSLAQLSNLTQLRLTRNQITVIPDSLAQLSNLTQLRLTRNQITVIPDSLAQLSNLTELNFGGNQITVIPDSLAQLSKLTQLDLGWNQITVIPDSLAQLSKLTQLDLGGNQITVIPDSLAQLSKLTQLRLWNNQITVIPDSLAQLSDLTELYLAQNKISDIPNNISSLLALELLELSDNRIQELPHSLTSLENLKVLHVEDNPLSIPSETLRQGWGKEYSDPGNPKQILDYYFAIRDPDQADILYEVKLLLVGEGSSGKTSLANKILESDYSLKPEAEDTSTQGIDILDWEFTGSNGKNYKIHIWDFGGQEMYHQTHQFFLTERACYLLVADSRKENTDHYFWLQSIQLLGKNSPVHLIQNEKQDRTINLNINQLRGEFENLRETHRTNLSDNRGLDELRRAIQHELENLIPDGIPFPNKWLAVRYTLENDPRNYLDYTDYEATCRRNGITNTDEIYSLSRFLHELGIVLHFQKDPILKRCLILKPNWGTAAVYEILDNKTVHQNLGQFSDADLETIWADEQYTDMRHELLQLMKAFKVCYEIPGRPGHYIAPHLLSSDSPTYPWPTEQNLILRYDYKTFMPKGILTRFIVEMHRRIENVNDPENAYVWKTGVVLINGTTRAEITEYYHQREIHIRVCGPRPRDLLTIINHKFEDIHYEFYEDAIYQPNPPFDTLIPCNCPTCKPRPDPYLFPLDRLHTYLERNRYKIECYESGEDIDVRSLIDGVIREHNEDFEAFPEKLSAKHDYDRMIRRKGRRNSVPSAQPVVNIYNSNQQDQAMSGDKTWTGDRINGDKVTGDKVAGNKMQIGAVQGDAIAGNKTVNTQNLAQAAQDIKALINQLSTDYDTTTPSGKRKLSDRVLETLEGNKTVQSRALNALKEVGKTAFEEAIDHPVARVLVAGLEGYME